MKSDFIQAIEKLLEANNLDLMGDINSYSKKSFGTSTRGQFALNFMQEIFALNREKNIIDICNLLNTFSFSKRSQYENLYNLFLYFFNCKDSKHADLFFQTTVDSKNPALDAAIKIPVHYFGRQPSEEFYNCPLRLRKKYINKIVSLNQSSTEWLYDFSASGKFKTFLKRFKEGEADYLIEIFLKAQSFHYNNLVNDGLINFASIDSKCYKILLSKMDNKFLGNYIKQAGDGYLAQRAFAVMTLEDQENFLKKYHNSHGVNELKTFLTDTEKTIKTRRFHNLLVMG
jgi:hypothetical protein